MVPTEPRSRAQIRLDDNRIQGIQRDLYFPNQVLSPSQSRGIIILEKIRRILSYFIIKAYSNDSKLFYLMQSIWEFKEVEGCPDQCEICFTTEFEFRSALYSQVAGYFLDYVTSKNMEAFISRLNLVYGAKT